MMLIRCRDQFFVHTINARQCIDVDCIVNCFLVAVFCSSFNEVMAATLRLLYSVSRPGKISEVQFSVILNIGEIKQNSVATCLYLSSHLPLRCMTFSR